MSEEAFEHCIEVLAHVRANELAERLAFWRAKRFENVLVRTGPTVFVASLASPVRGGVPPCSYVEVFYEIERTWNLALEDASCVTRFEFAVKRGLLRGPEEVVDMPSHSQRTAVRTTVLHAPACARAGRFAELDVFGALFKRPTLALAENLRARSECERLPTARAGDVPRCTHDGRYSEAWDEAIPVLPRENARVRSVHLCKATWIFSDNLLENAQHILPLLAGEDMQLKVTRNDQSIEFCSPYLNYILGVTYFASYKK